MFIALFMSLCVIVLFCVVYAMIVYAWIKTIDWLMNQGTIGEILALALTFLGYFLLISFIVSLFTED